MKLQIKTTFSFSKLANKIEKIIENTASNFGKSAAVGIKTSLERGNFEPLSKTTIDIRKKGISPKSGYIATGSTKPLIHTGRLRDSIKPKKGGVELFRYGAYHNAGYKTTHNAFTGRYFKETGVQIANQNVPARPFIDRGILMKTKEKEEVFKNFSRAIKQSLKK